eukprot:CAMPEP_0206585200 /NCGR_PEP_ID=MMETSP0325_2-20121206/36274_1 /ASSEMBLY_ACC=CAM_ASM_000347 /TAXON_ID=2866 /ORGANISM="Crypthecodinium cohnii, Strain Seligo" /LENGTH=242 /DNA_ID=CAMNT_0054092699 /DNA_START=1 /DNA_END=730 /DNA_ORIENTATION=-
MMCDTASSHSPQGHLVWCHERCQKKETIELLGHLQALAKEIGYAFHTFKKAPTYEAWLTRVHPEKHILVTDNRELKPCLAFLSEAFEIPCPTLLAVFGQMNERILDRVRRVVRALSTKHNPRAIPFEVCDSLELVCDDVRYHAGSKLCDTPTAMATTTTTATLDPDQVLRLPFLQDHEQSSSISECQVLPRSSNGQELEVFPSHVDILPAAVANIMKQFFPNHTSTEVHQALVESQPEFYTD